MSVLTILLLFVIAYYCFKAIGNIWHDAFKGVTPKSNGRKSKQRYAEAEQRQTHAQSRSTKPIEKGEGEYVDFTEER